MTPKPLCTDDWKTLLSFDSHAFGKADIDQLLSYGKSNNGKDEITVIVLIANKHPRQYKAPPKEALKYYLDELNLSRVRTVNSIERKKAKGPLIKDDIVPVCNACNLILKKLLLSPVESLLMQVAQKRPEGIHFPNNAINPVGALLLEIRSYITILKILAEGSKQDLESTKTHKAERPHKKTFHRHDLIKGLAKIWKDVFGRVVGENNQGGIIDGDFEKFSHFVLVRYGEEISLKQTQGLVRRLFNRGELP